MPTCLCRPAHQAIQLDGSSDLAVWFIQFDVEAYAPQHAQRCEDENAQNMAGWRRIEGESWQETMHRMRGRVTDLQSRVVCPDVSERLFSFKWGLARRLFGNSRIQKWAHLLLQLTSTQTRSRGRPPMQWLDDIEKFLLAEHEHSLQHVLERPAFEEKYVTYCMRGLP